MDILYQDNRIAVCLKPPGVLSTDEPGGMPSLLRAALGTDCVRTVHRLDAAVGGVMVFARSRLAAEKSRLTAVRESFVPWQQLPLPLETLGTQHTRILLGTVPAQTDLEALRARVFEAADEVQLEQISADQQSLYLLVIVHKSAYDAAASALRESGFTQTCFDGVTGTAAENIRLTDEKLAACEQEDKRLTDKINIPFHIAEDPLHAVAKGTGIALKNVDRFSFLMR